MATTASVAINPSSVTAQAQCAVTLTVNNSRSVPISVTGIVPLFYPTSQQTDGPSGAVGVCALGPGVTVSIPATSSLTFSWSVIGFAPQGGFWAQGGSSLTYVVGATVYTNAAEIVTASTATLTVTHFP